MNKIELYKEIDSVEQQISRIYFEIMDQNEISPYRRGLIEEKLNLLAMKLEAIVGSIGIINHIEITEIKKKMKRTGILSILVLVLMFINPLLALPVNLYTMHRLMKLRGLLFNKKEDEQAEEVEKQLKTISIMVQNCDTFMNAKYKKREERIISESSDRDQEISKINAANEALGYILFGGNVTELPEELKFYITKMLQEDLETDEETLEVLVNMAREKISIETLNNELDLKMQLIKIEEKK
ncbi:MAG: hypothetical protein IJY87_00340 [Bacilli bacterium]|nr:hypothetical protein [Bacilli bacterium]MBQ8901499.1 hypothetical protein [Bacilli bacterium]